MDEKVFSFSRMEELGEEVKRLRAKEKELAEYYDILGIANSRIQNLLQELRQEQNHFG